MLDYLVDTGKHVLRVEERPDDSHQLNAGAHIYNKINMLTEFQFPFGEPFGLHPQQKVNKKKRDPDDNPIFIVYPPAIRWMSSGLYTNFASRNDRNVLNIGAHAVTNKVKDAVHSAGVGDPKM